MHIRVKTCQNVSKTYFLTLFFDTCSRLREVCKFVSKSVKKTRVKTCFATPTCQNVSNVSKKQKRPKTQGFACLNVSQSVKTCQNVSKSVKKVSNKCQQRVKTCQSVSKNSARCSVSCQNVSKNKFFDTFFDTHFCLLGCWVVNLTAVFRGLCALIAS